MIMGTYFENKFYMKLGLVLAVIGILFIGLYSPIYDYIFEISKFQNMALAGKHLFGSIEDQRVTFIEKKAEKPRIDFLKKLLEFNGFEVVIQEDKRKTEEEPQLYTLGVTDMTFHPTIWVFERRLKTLDGQHKVTQDYWNQLSEDANPAYWKND